jgi:hypothetical protein
VFVRMGVSQRRRLMALGNCRNPPARGRSAAGPKPCLQPDFHPANTMPSHRPAATRSPTPETPTGDGHGRAMANDGQVLAGKWSGNGRAILPGNPGNGRVVPGRGRAMTRPLRTPSNGLANALQSGRCPAVALPLCTPARERSPGMGIAWKTPAGPANYKVTAWPETGPAMACRAMLGKGGAQGGRLAGQWAGQAGCWLWCRPRITCATLQPNAMGAAWCLQGLVMAGSRAPAITQPMPDRCTSIARPPPLQKSQNIDNNSACFDATAAPPRSPAEQHFTGAAPNVVVICACLAAHKCRNREGRSATAACMSPRRPCKSRRGDAGDGGMPRRSLIISHRGDAGDDGMSPRRCW